jgi:hypothetical protein
MTHEQWMELTTEEQRFKVAESLGLAPFYCGDGTMGSRPPDLLYRASHDELKPVPNFLADLNAMHACMLMVRNRRLFANYYRHLRDVFAQRRLDFSTWDEHNTSAEIRAEAFVMTMEEQ